jgi:hypothetical protein
MKTSLSLLLLISGFARAHDAWGDPTCPGAPGGRQSMEMYELRRAAPRWELAWHGCVVSKQEFNDVAALSDGGFIATHPTALRAPQDTSNLLGGQATGYVPRWSAATGEVEMPGTRIGYPTGVVVTPDARYIYVNACTAREVDKYDLKDGKETSGAP